MAIVIGVLLVLVVAMAVAFNRGRQDGDTPVGATAARRSPPARTAVHALNIAAVRDFDPDGDPPEENPDTAKNAIDGDPDTSWTTVTYRGNPALGGLKPGVGLMLDLGRDQKASSLTVRFKGAPTSFDVYAAPAGVTDVPDSVDQLDKVGGQQSAPERSTVTLDPAPTTRYLLVWLTRLPAADGGLPRGDHRDHGQVVTLDGVGGSGREDSDVALLEAHLAGDPDAFGELFRRHRDRLWAVALRTTGNPEDAADALQDALISAFRRADSFRGDAAVTTWLHRIVVNACLDRLRRRKVRAADPLPDDLDEAAARGAVLAGPDGHRGPDPGTGGPRARRRAPRPGAGGAGGAPSRPEGGAGAGRHGGVPGRRGGRDPRGPHRHGEEPLRARAVAARRTPRGPGAAGNPGPAGCVPFGRSTR